MLPAGESVLKGAHPMSRANDFHRWIPGGVAVGALPATVVPGRDEANPREAEGRTLLRTRIIERTALVRFAAVRILLDEGVVRSVGDQLDRLIEAEGRTRLLLNLDGVRYLSSDMLSRLA